MAGRGGIGNIQAVTQENARATSDVEADRTAAENRVHQDVIDVGHKQDQEYAHTGRGGSGNIYSPKALSSKGHFNDAHRSHIVGDGTLLPADTTSNGPSAPPSYSTANPSSETGVTRKVGRGGAGNYSFGVTESEVLAAERRRGMEEQMKKQVAEDVEKGVSETLAQPPKAKLAPGES